MDMHLQMAGEGDRVKLEQLEPKKPINPNKSQATTKRDKDLIKK